MRESRLQRKIQRYIKHDLGHWCHKNHGNAFSQPGLPDLTVIMRRLYCAKCCRWSWKGEHGADCLECHEGILYLLERTIWFEVKMPGEELSEVQKECHRRMRKHGAEVHTISSREEAKEVIVGKEHRAAQT